MQGMIGQMLLVDFQAFIQSEINKDCPHVKVII